MESGGEAQPEQTAFVTVAALEAWPDGAIETAMVTTTEVSVPPGYRDVASGYNGP